MTIKGIKKIISLGPDELSEYDLERDHYSSEPKEKEGRVKADVFIYWYSNGGYDGTGFATWRRSNKWYYQYLGHCSCNGPTENLETSDNAGFTLNQILKILDAEYNWNDSSTVVADYLKKYYVK